MARRVRCGAGGFMVMVVVLGLIAHLARLWHAGGGLVAEDDAVVVEIVLGKRLPRQAALDEELDEYALPSHPEELGEEIEPADDAPGPSERDEADWLVGEAGAGDDARSNQTWAPATSPASAPEGSSLSSPQASSLPRADAKAIKEPIFIKPDFSLVNKRFRKEPMIRVDFPFHHFTDRYGLASPLFNETVLIEMLREVSNVWIKGNIYVRFRLDDVRTPWRIPDDKADAYRWWVMAEKSKSSPAYGRDFDEMLVNGPGRLGLERAKRIAGSLTKTRNGHNLLNWILGIGSQRRDLTRTFFNIYTVFFYKWYNGGRTGGRIFVRSGSCGDPSKTLPGSSEPVRCKGWQRRAADGARPMHTAEFVRIVAHEIGHAFNLNHPPANCYSAKTAEEMLLMPQQLAVTVDGYGPCGESNEISKFSRLVRNFEFDAARGLARMYSRRQRRLYARFPELASMRRSISEREMFEKIALLGDDEVQT